MFDHPRLDYAHTHIYVQFTCICVSFPNKKITNLAKYDIILIKEILYVNY